MSYISKPVKIPDVPGKITLRERGDRVYVMKTQKDRPLVSPCVLKKDQLPRKSPMLPSNFPMLWYLPE